MLASYIATGIFVLISPLAYMIVAGIGLYSSETSTTTRDTVSSTGLSGAIANSVASAANGTARGRVVSIIVGAILTAWAGRGALRALRLAHAMAWRVPVPKTPLTEVRGVAFGFVVVGLCWLGTWTTRLRQNGAGIALSSVLMGAVVFVARLPASVELYVAPRLSRTTATYGALGGGLVLLTYLLVVSWAIVLAAELNAAVLDWRIRRQEAV